MTLRDPDAGPVTVFAHQGGQVVGRFEILGDRLDIRLKAATDYTLQLSNTQGGFQQLHVPSLASNQLIALEVDFEEN
ncbi:hypothetical protein D3C72_2415610 [compost metagenome]